MGNLTATDVAKIAAEVTNTPVWFCANWIAARTAINAIVAQISNPLAGVLWAVVRGILNRVYHQCPTSK